MYLVYTEILLWLTLCDATIHPVMPLYTLCDATIHRVMPLYTRIKVESILNTGPGHVAR